MKYYLIYWEGEGGDSESYSVFYSKLIQADSEIEAWEIWKNRFPNYQIGDEDNHGIEKMDIWKK